MNEQIKVLVKQSGAWFPRGYPSPEGGERFWNNAVVFQPKDLQKFAEMIVAECLEHVIDEVQYRLNHDAADEIVKRVRTNFGLDR